MDQTAPAAPATSPAPVKAPNSPVDASIAPVSTLTPTSPQNAPEVKLDPLKEAEAKRRAANIARVKRKEAELLKKDQAFQAEREKFNRENAVLLDKAKHLDTLSELAKTDPLKYLEAAGIKFDDIAKRVMKGDTRSTEEIAQTLVQAEMVKFKDEQAKMVKEREELDRRAQLKAQEESIKTQVEAAKNQIKELFESDPEKYEFINNTPGAADLVWDLVMEYHEQTFDSAKGQGKILPYDEALQTVEQSLEAEFYERSKSSKKLQARMEKERLEAQAKVNESAKTADKFDRYGRKVQEKKAEPVIETKSEPKTVEVVEKTHLKPNKKKGLNAILAETIARSKASLDK